jgi:endonuclease/exonuclease/phosphatase family metal-dependent hydrolase
MADVKAVVWNMEWMNDLFGPNDLPPAFKADQDKPFHAPGSTVKQRRDDLSGVLNEIEPDVVVVVEGPNRAGELELFFDQDVAGDWVVQVQPSKGQSQNVGIAVRTDQGKFQNPPLKYFDTNNLEVFDPFLVDTDGDEIQENYKFERRPLYVELNPTGGDRFRILGLHLKSKGVFNAYEWSKWWQKSDANRRKILAQATELRSGFLEPYLEANETKNVPIVLCGDINDGPGLDASEKRLFGSGVERLMGTVWNPDMCLRNALFETLSLKDQSELDFTRLSTTSFKDPIFNNVWQRVWIDHVLYPEQGRGQWVKDAKIWKDMAGGQKIWAKYKHASDHFPVEFTVST